MLVGHSKNINIAENQYHHWIQAAARLSKLENLASSYAWNGVDNEARKTILKTLHQSIDRLKRFGSEAEIVMNASGDPLKVHRVILQLRALYLKTESTVHFFTDALNSRTNASVATLLRACDILCHKSMEAALLPLRKPIPHCFTYLDKGLGASILKSGLRLWDGSISETAAIKITFHNLYRPTAAIHETGHQVAHILDWNDELGNILRNKLDNPAIANLYASWASEIAADNFAFVHTGYAAVASLHNVIAGTEDSVFAFHEGDPHPNCFIRLLLNIECCRRYGKGPWDHLEDSFRETYRIGPSHANHRLIVACERAIKKVADLCLDSKLNAFGGKTLAQAIDPMKVSPEALRKFETTSGSLLNSHAWIHNECLRMLALTGLNIATADDRSIAEAYAQQERWTKILGQTIQSN